MGRPGLRNHRKFRRLARTIGSEAMARGCLELLWDMSYENGDDYLGDTNDVEAAVGWSGEPGTLTSALLEAGGEGNAGFIEEVPGRKGQYRVHDLFDHAPRYVSTRLARELERQQHGVTISQIRSEAGRKGANVTNNKKASHRQDAANGQQTVSNQSASEQQFAATPAPAHAPKRQNPLSEQQSCSDERGLVGRKKTGNEPSPEANNLAALLKSEILKNKSDSRIECAQERNWAVTADRMLRLDRRTYEEVADLILWAQHDEFWMSNVLSMSTLREKFDQLQMKRDSACGKRPNGRQLIGTPPKIGRCPLAICDGSGWWIERGTRRRVDCECRLRPMAADADSSESRHQR